MLLVLVAEIHRSSFASMAFLGNCNSKKYKELFQVLFSSQKQFPPVSLSKCLVNTWCIDMHLNDGFLMLLHLSHIYVLVDHGSIKLNLDEVNIIQLRYHANGVVSSVEDASISRLAPKHRTHRAFVSFRSVYRGRRPKQGSKTQWDIVLFRLFL